MPAKTDRRSNRERRNNASRRRHVDTRRMYVELCRSVLRVALVVDDERRSKPQLTTRTVRWREEAPNLLCEQGEAELAAALRRIVVEERLAGCRVSFAISGTLCVNRATSGATTKVEQDINAFEDRSQLYLSLGPGPKTTAVGRKPIDARHEHALVTVANRASIDMLVGAAESAGLVVDVVESSLIALGRLHGQIEPEGDPVILAQLDEDRFEIGVSGGGQLLLEYRPPSDATVASLGAILEDHRNRLERFCRRRYGLGTMELDRLWLVGEADQVDRTSTKTTAPVTTGVLPMACVDDLWDRIDSTPPTAEMAAVLGLAVRGRTEDSGLGPNLMDEIHAQAKPPVRPFLIRAGAPIAATLLIAAGLYAFNLEQRMEVSALQKSVEELRPLEMRGAHLSRRLRDAGVEIDHLSRLVDRTPRWSIDPLFERITHCLPEDVWLKQVRIRGAAATEVSGASHTESGVYDFVHHLEEAPGIQEVALRGTGVAQTAEGPATSFDIEITLAPLAPEDTNRE